MTAELPSLGAVRGPGLGASGQQGSGKKIAADFDAFLKMLTTQLQNQDPLSPLDTHQFTQQLVDFAGVEQQLAQTESLKDIASALQQAQLSQGVSYIGKEVYYQGNRAEIKQEGEGLNFDYKTPSGAYSAIAKIYDSSGALVAEQAIQPSALKLRAFSWDGATSDGQAAPVGSYRLEIEAFDREGEAVKGQADIRSYSRVLGARLENGDIRLTLTAGGDPQPLSKISAIQESS